MRNIAQAEDHVNVVDLDFLQEKARAEDRAGGVRAKVRSLAINSLVFSH